MDRAMPHHDSRETRRPVALDEPPRLSVHLGELYRVQPLPDEFVRLAVAVGESCSRVASKDHVPSPKHRRDR